MIRLLYLVCAGLAIHVALNSRRIAKFTSAIKNLRAQVVAIHKSAARDATPTVPDSAPVDQDAEIASLQARLEDLSRPVESHDPAPGTDPRVLEELDATQAKLAEYEARALEKQKQADRMPALFELSHLVAGVLKLSKPEDWPKSASELLLRIRDLEVSMGLPDSGGRWKGDVTFDKFEWIPPSRSPEVANPVVLRERNHPRKPDGDWADKAEIHLDGTLNMKKETFE